MPQTEALAEARREMEICNACRYCEGFCAVFPAMELHRDFADADLNYLANLCHNCRGCYYACQYAPPHEFAINVPRALAELRQETYAHYAWPAGMGRAFQRSGMAISLSIAAGIALVLVLTGLIWGGGVLGRPQHGPGAFYAVIPWGAMAAVAGATFLFSLLAFAMGGAKFWRESGARQPLTGRAAARALGDILTLRNLGASEAGCNDRSEKFSQGRRHSHHAMAYGFGLCFASTVVATIYDHFLHDIAPYPVLSVPVILGILGGVGMIAGGAGLFWLKAAGDAEPAAPALLGGDYALIVQLVLAAFTGLVLLAARDTAAMGALLAIHLGIILSLFVTAPYGKFVHGVYRGLALLRNAREQEGH